MGGMISQKRRLRRPGIVQVAGGNRQERYVIVGDGFLRYPVCLIREINPFISFWDPQSLHVPASPVYISYPIEYIPHFFGFIAYRQDNQGRFSYPLKTPFSIGIYRGNRPREKSGVVDSWSIWHFLGFSNRLSMNVASVRSLSRLDENVSSSVLPLRIVISVYLPGALSQPAARSSSTAVAASIVFFRPPPSPACRNRHRGRLQVPCHMI